jgi:hypothetical protein
VTIGTGFPIYEGGEEGLLPSVNILCFHCSTLASTIQTTFLKVSTDLIPAVPLWLRDRELRRSVCSCLLRPFFTAGCQHRISSSVTAPSCPWELAQIHEVPLKPVLASMAKGNDLCLCLHELASHPHSRKEGPCDREMAKEKEKVVRDSKSDTNTVRNRCTMAHRAETPWPGHCRAEHKPIGPQAKEMMWAGLRGVAQVTHCSL